MHDPPSRRGTRDPIAGADRGGDRDPEVDFAAAGPEHIVIVVARGADKKDDPSSATALWAGLNIRSRHDDGRVGWAESDPSMRSSSPPPRRRRSTHSANNWRPRDCASHRWGRRLDSQVV